MDFVIAELALVFLPGIIWANLDSKYVNGSQTNQFNTIIKSFMFGVTTYSILFLIYGVFGKEFSYDKVTAVSADFELRPFLDEIVFSIPLALILSIFWMYIQNYRILTRFLHFIHASERFGDQDVWTFTLNSGEPHVEYVNVRDLENNLTYSGWVNSFSEKEEIRELLLEDAIIYNDEDGDELSRSPHLYISLTKAHIIMEFPYTENEDFYDVDE